MKTKVIILFVTVFLATLLLCSCNTDITLEAYGTKAETLESNTEGGSGGEVEDGSDDLDEESGSDDFGDEFGSDDFGDEFGSDGVGSDDFGDEFGSDETTETSEATETTATTEATETTETESATETTTESETDTDISLEAWAENVILDDGFAADGTVGYELIYFDQEVFNRFADAILFVAQDLDGLATVYEMTAPGSCCFGLTPEQNKALGADDAQATMEYFHSYIKGQNIKMQITGELKNPLISIDICDLMREHYDEYIFFRTDHHWTGLGAYYASRYFLDIVGKSYPALSEYEPVTIEGGFLGSLHRHTQSAVLADNPDTVYAYRSPTTTTFRYQNSSGEMIEHPIINEGASKYSNKYLAFSYGDCTYCEMHNETITDGSSILLIKDSFGNSLMPMLIDSYEYVYGIDYRSWKGDLSEFVKEKGIDTVLIVNYQACVADPPYARRWESFVAIQKED